MTSIPFNKIGRTVWSPCISSKHFANRDLIFATRSGRKTVVASLLAEKSCFIGL